MLIVKPAVGTHGHLILTLHGELDAFNAGRFRRVLEHLGDPAHVVLDLSGIPFIDSAGLGALVGGIRRTRELGGDVVVCCNRPSVRRLLHNTGLDEIVTITTTPQDADGSFGPTGSDRGNGLIAVDRIDD